MQRSPSPELQFLQGPGKPPRNRPPRRHVDHGKFARRQSRRNRTTAWILTAALIVVSVGIWASPAARRATTTSEFELALSKEMARSDDLRRQNAELTRRLKAPRPVSTDGAQLARAEDLARQVDDLERRLGIRRPPATDKTQQARADDLLQRLREAQALLQAPRTQTTDGSQLARAEDLSRQVKDLSGQLARPRTTADRFAGVTAHLTKAEIVSAQHQFGLYTAQAPFNWGEAGMVEDAVQRKANIVGYFQDWNDPFRADAIQLAWQRHQIPMLTWEPAPTTGREDPNDTANLPFNLLSIKDGLHDDYIRSYARGIKELGMPIIVRLAHEMNGDWYPWSEIQNKDHDGNGLLDDCDVAPYADDTKGIDPKCSINGNGPGQFREMWQHVHQVFAEEGANDLTIWLWAPNRVNNITNPVIHQPTIERFYPGDQYVDWVGMSGYLRYSDRDDPPTFDMTFGDTLTQLQATAPTKHVFLAEIGATELNGTKAQWVDSLFDGLARNRDIISGFAWFSLTVSAMKGDEVQTNDWRINSTGPARDALANGLAGGGYGLPVG